jgi:hypothetical protein
LKKFTISKKANKFLAQYEKTDEIYKMETENSQIGPALMGEY